MNAYMLKKNVLVHDWPPHPVCLGWTLPFPFFSAWGYGIRDSPYLGLLIRKLSFLPPSIRTGWGWVIWLARFSHVLRLWYRARRGIGHGIAPIGDKTTFISMSYIQCPRIFISDLSYPTLFTYFTSLAHFPIQNILQQLIPMYSPNFLNSPIWLSQLFSFLNFRSSPCSHPHSSLSR